MHLRLIEKRSAFNTLLEFKLIIYNLRVLRIIILLKSWEPSNGSVLGDLGFGLLDLKRERLGLEDPRRNLT